MSKIIVKDTWLTNIANAIRSYTGKTGTMKPSSFASNFVPPQVEGEQFTLKFYSLASYGYSNTLVINDAAAKKYVTFSTKPSNTSNKKVKCSVSWGDGTIQDYTDISSGKITFKHKYSCGGEYKVFMTINPTDGADVYYIESVLRLVSS